MADPASTGRPAALFIAPIMPSDRGNGLAMRTGFLLDSYAKRFAIDLAVAPVAAGATTLTPFVEARVRRAVVLPHCGPRYAFHTDRQRRRRQGSARGLSSIWPPLDHRAAERRA